MERNPDKLRLLEGHHKLKRRPQRHREVDQEKEHLGTFHRMLEMGGQYTRPRPHSSVDVSDSVDKDQGLETELRGIRVDQKLLVAAIDIGTTYSGYAFSFVHEQTGSEADPDRIHVNTWENEGGSRTYFKTPSCLLLHPNGNLDCFGNEAIEKYNTLAEDKKHHDRYFFWQFKMTLHQEEVSMILLNERTR